jgi:hypothetical protein
LESPYRRNLLEGLDIDGRIIFKMDLRETGLEGVK